MRLLKNLTIKPYFLAMLFCVPLANTASAQSFFSSLVLDPAVGVDRGSASRLQKQDEPAAFLTFANTGSDEAGKAVAGFGLARPNLVLDGDQLDFAAVLAGPSADGKAELIAGGLAYRFPESGGGTTPFVSIDYGELELGSAALLPLGIKGDRLQVALGLRHVRDLGKTRKLLAGVELLARDINSEYLGAPNIDESLRMLRASLMYTKGVPLSFQQRYRVAMVKGFDAAGASPVSNPLSSVAGASSDFLRVAFAAEASVPLSMRWVVNAGVIGQWTGDSLPASQRCGFAANNYMRGFDNSAVTGDRCLGTRVELAHNFELPNPRADRVTFTQGYIGIDGGQMINLANSVLPASENHWSSLSTGIRTLRGNFIGEIYVTRILDRATTVTPQSRSRLWFRGAVKF